MAIVDYPSLQAALQNWLNRYDSTTLARIPEFIDLAEKRLQRKQSWFQELYSIANGAPLNVAGSPIQLPNYIRRILTVFNANGATSTPNFRSLNIVPISMLHDLMNTNLNVAGTPIYAAVSNVTAMTPQVTQGLAGPLTIDLTDITIDETVITQPAETALGAMYLHLWPMPAATTPSMQIDLEYVRKLPPLALYNTNALLAEFPDVYLYASLLESAPYLQHDERLTMWNQEFAIRVAEVDAERERSKYGATPTRVRLPHVFG